MEQRHWVEHLEDEVHANQARDLTAKVIAYALAGLMVVGFVALAYVAWDAMRPATETNTPDQGEGGGDATPPPSGDVTSQGGDGGGTGAAGSA